MEIEVTFSETYVLQELRQQVALSSQKDVAAKYRVSPQFICDVLKKRRPVSSDLAKAMGYTRVAKFERRKRKP